MEFQRPNGLENGYSFEVNCAVIIKIVLQMDLLNHPLCFSEQSDFGTPPFIQCLWGIKSFFDLINDSLKVVLTSKGKCHSYLKKLWWPGSYFMYGDFAVSLENSRKWAVFLYLNDTDMVRIKRGLLFPMFDPIYLGMDGVLE